MVMKDGTRGHVSLHLMCFSSPVAHIEIDQGGREVRDKKEIVGAGRSERCNIAKKSCFKKTEQGPRHPQLFPSINASPSAFFPRSHWAPVAWP